MKIRGIANPYALQPFLNRVIHADCLELLQEFPDECIDILLTDIPYGISYQSNRRVKTKKFRKLHGDRDIAEWFPDFLHCAVRILKPQSNFLCFCHAKTFATIYPIISNTRELHYRTLLTWDKEWHGSGDLKATWSPTTEFILHAQKGRRALFGGRSQNIIRVQRLASTHLQHSTQKPLSLLTQLIEPTTQPGEVVLDPFCGSGSTCKAASLLWRHYIGIEIDSDNYRVAVTNMKSLKHE